MTPRTYTTPAAFKQALEARLRSSTTSGAQFARKRQLLVFDRFLARVACVFGNTATLKGGLALELRIAHARTTKDIDLRVMGSRAAVLENLQEAGRLALGDFMTFEVVPDNDHPDIQNDGTRYDGYRFRGECLLAGKIYQQAFGVDVAFGDPILGEPEIMTTEDVLDFAGVAPPTIQLYPVETHIAEKLHAYTLPRLNPNSRVKDLPDIALLSTVQNLDANRLRKAFAQTFAFRKTHSVPEVLPAPLPAWEKPYATMARENDLTWSTLAEVTHAAQTFLNPVLAGNLDALWDYKTSSWRQQ